MKSALRYAAYLAIFLTGVVAVSLAVGTLFEREYAQRAGPLVLLAYIAAFIYWTRRREARLVDTETNNRRNAVAHLLLSCLGITGGAVLVVVFFPILDTAMVHPLVAPIVFLPFLLGVIFVVLGIRGIATSFAKDPKA